ncbi:hypothetical protein A2331_01775 [Candidatus Falkowbacteria bacterium RIFOXYB2_FULL_34_18]|uniref:Uncharacterized protein n=1 Tax=Candidatus Falkowbacteria bacterium RIFOXYD2_FULL_34_120 TaxID=1798007 RepID=A0A1F5TQ88_9BACT|nr:MAG: hypothetical protein A2331_01775 [Candidatus Falkowbacteria bacterium RIFOXYB2_FULL_34_18]OGF29417.1 MAG: hypothetical protein A2500_00840 [Candidatus Falkowbacteria bacterium RIFOXYC12_FULL_34_55]OGF36730.1 MAG: hypothetical protein A2466_03150 [Candidatus Falkowbacteria bacterium RIFOXYC2_FULL_34_220]OGF38943.1 MAG: hypothetical protein A2515_05265 [Candidatus Falkowbacteria bacterium RIFOXYD12_FULL_34_57]OGF41135.1 MAG: hypothetical protein A2531_01265 [Candidatus Falkowbacteria bact
MPYQQKNNQSWRINKKKYYLTRKTKTPIKKTKRLNLNLSIFDFSNNFKQKVFLFLLGSFVVCLMIGVIFIAWLSRNLPNPGGLIERELAQSTKIMDRTGEEILYEIHGEEKRTLVKLNEIPNYVKYATIAIEDKNFYSHGGISLWGIFRGTVLHYIRYGTMQGGSTLTQQFVKNAILTNERTVTRKLKEWILAYKIEKKYSKDEILQMYFNEIPYGSTAYGVEAASQKYFGKSARNINIAEAAILAALPQAPSRYSPYGSNIEILLGRQQYIIDLMLEQGYITEEEAKDAKEFKIEFKEQGSNIKAPHFVMYIKEILSNKYGEKMVEQGGLKIYTTLDIYKQKIAEDVINELAEKNEKDYNATNASLISIDPKTGQVLAMVGSRDYFNNDIDGQVNITTSNRQPGSSLKPLVYATMFLKGYTPNTILYDVITSFSTNKDEPYEPHNYDNKEHGPVTIRKALAGSLNIPAVKAIYLADIDKVLELATDMGYTTLTDKNRFGLSLVLGGAEVKLIEHVNAYGVFAREGIFHPITTILKIEDKDGNLIEEAETKEKKVLDPKIARLINDVLSDNAARAYAFGERNWLTLSDRPVAAKTGTTNDYRDAWTIGYTPSIVTGVWVGNNNNSEMKKGAAGGVVAAPIWHNYMKKVLGNTPIEGFKKIEIEKTGKPVLDGEAGMETVIKIDKSSGLLATENTPPDKIEEKIFIQPHSILYYVDKNDPLGPKPENPEKDPQFKEWEKGVALWLEKKLASSSPNVEIIDQLPPTEYDNTHTIENLPEVKIISPINNKTILTPLLISTIEASAKRGINRVEYYINDNLFFINTSYPFGIEKTIDFLNNGFHNLKVKVCDDVDNCTTKEVEFNLVLNNNIQNKDITVKIINPVSGLALSNIDFPLTVKFDIDNPKQVANINLYYIGEDNNPVLIKNIQPITESITATIWDNPPASGTYKIYSEINTWGKKKIKTEDIFVIINNISNSIKEDNE